MEEIDIYVCVRECGAFVVVIVVFLLAKLFKIINIAVGKGRGRKSKMWYYKIISWIEYLLQILIPGNKTPF